MAYIEQRVNSNGGVRFRALIRIKGHASQSATFERKTDAKRWVQQTEAAMREGRHFKTAEAKRHTVAELIDAYVQNVLPRKPKSASEQLRQLRWWKDHIGQTNLADISPGLIATGRDRLANQIVRGGNKRSPATVNRYLAALSHVFTIAVKEWGWMPEHPMQRISRLKEHKGRVRYLSDDERALLLEACMMSRNKLLYPIVVLALSTGMRKNEIRWLKWKDVDLERGVAVLHETKNDERRAVSISGHALAQLKMLQDCNPVESEFIFPGSKPTVPIDIRTAWETARDKAQLQDFRFHDLRHCTASYLAMNGASLAEIAAVLGHRSFDMVKRYAHLSEQHTAGVVASMNEKIFGNG